MARNYYDLLMTCNGNGDAKKKCEESMHKLAKELKQITNTSSKETTPGQSDSEEDSTSSSPIKDPTRRIVVKGRPKKDTNKRVKSHWERKRTGTSRPNEYGSITPNKKLF